MWVVTHFLDLYALVMTAVHTAEQAPAESDAKRQAAAAAIASGLASLGAPESRVITGIIGAMIDVYVGVRNVLEGHGWYGSAPSGVTPTVSSSAPTLTPSALAGSGPGPTLDTSLANAQLAAANARERAANAALDNAAASIGAPTSGADPAAPTSAPASPPANPSAASTPQTGTPTTPDGTRVR